MVWIISSMLALCVILAALGTALSLKCTLNMRIVSRLHAQSLSGPRSSRDVAFTRVERARQLAKVAALMTPALTAGLSGPVLVYADFRAAQKRTYFRYIPKLIDGVTRYKGDLKKSIDNDDFNDVREFFKVYVSKYNSNDPKQIDATDTFVNVHFFRPMTIFAGSFAERGTSEKQRALMAQVEAFAKAMSDLEGCIKDRKGEGFFAPDIKMPTGNERKKQAQEAYQAGKTALNTYIEIANKGLMLELNKLEQF